MNLDYPVESVTFTGLGAEGPTAQAAAEALARALNAWAASQKGRRLLHLTTVPTPAAAGVGLAAILVHTAGPELGRELAAEVAAAVEEAIEEMEEREAADLDKAERCEGAS